MGSAHLTCAPTVNWKYAPERSSNSRKLAAGSNDIGIGRGVGGETLDDDGEEVVAFEAADHLGLVGV